MIVTTKNVGRYRGDILVNFFIDDRLVGTLAFDKEKYHEQWDSVVDHMIETPTPPGLT